MEKAALDSTHYEPCLPDYMPARIMALGQVSSAPCVVREISQAGAILQVDDGWILPRTFWLCIEGETCMHYCTAVWRKGSELYCRLGESRTPQEAFTHSGSIG
jgi:hypothetical protein